MGSQTDLRWAGTLEPAMRNLLMPVAIVVLSALHLACPLDPRCQRTETRTLALKTDGKVAAKVEARAFNGSIRMETWDQDNVELIADIREVDPGDITLHTEAKEGRVEIWAERIHGSSFPGGAGGISYVLRVPQKVQANLSTSNGSIQASDLKGSLEARTSNGSIKVWNLDKGAILNTSNASVHLRHVLGDCEVHTSNGSLHAEDIPGDLRGSTSNASIHLEDVKGAIDLSTSNGSIHASGLDGKGRGIRLSTSNSSVEANLGEAKGDVDLRTSRSENIDVQHPKAEVLETGSHTRLRIPGSSQSIQIATSNGRITLR